jgi:hypothetical protein
MLQGGYISIKNAFFLEMKKTPGEFPEAVVNITE